MGGPQGNIHGSVRVSSGGVAAEEATEVGLIGSVTWITRAAYQTGVSNIARVNRDYQHTGLLHLVPGTTGSCAPNPCAVRVGP